MSLTESKLFVENLLKPDFEDAREVKRRNRLMKEITSLSFSLDKEDLVLFNEYRENEYQQYRLMLQSQIIRFDNYLSIDKFSRRLLIQFPADWYEGKPEDYMPCPESFIVFYNTDGQYEVVVNFRSTELSRCSEDISIIKALCEKELVLPGHITQIKVHCMNIHTYLDKGSSEDFDVTEGYFNRKDV